MPHLDEGQLTALLDGELPSAERQEAESHLAGCTECRQLLEETRSFFQEAGSLIDAVQLPVDLPTRPVAAAPPTAIDSRPDRRSAERRARLPNRLVTWRSLGWAASLVFAVGLGWVASDLRFRGSALAPMSDMKAADAAVVALDTPAVQAERSATNAVAPATPPAAPSVAQAKPAPRAEERRSREAPSSDVPSPAKAAEAVATAQTTARDQLAERREARPVDRVPEAAGVAAPQPAAASTALVTPPAAPGAANYADAGSRPDKSMVRAVTLDAAVRSLGGTIRLLDGLVPVRVESLEPRVAGSTRIRVVYLDPPGRELWLEQERQMTQGRLIPGELDDRSSLIAGDTLSVAGSGGRQTLAWRDQTGLRLGLTGFLPADSLRGLARRVR